MEVTDLDQREAGATLLGGGRFSSGGLVSW